MAAYIIADITITDPAGYEAYRQGVGANIAQFGGRIIARGTPPRILEGESTPTRLVVIEFESMEQAVAWYSSPEYAPLLHIRLRTAESKVILVQGV